MSSHNLILAFDSGSPLISVAVQAHGEVLSGCEEQTRSSTQIPRLASQLLATADRSWNQLDAVVAARGPGSFTGLRVGLAFALGLHQSLQIPGTAISTLRLLAQSVAIEEPVVAAVNAWKGSWFAQAFDAPTIKGQLRQPLTEPRKVRLPELETLNMPVIVANQHKELPDALRGKRSLAEIALSVATHPVLDWQPATLQNPLYLAAAPATKPSGPKPLINFN